MRYGVDISHTAQLQLRNSVISDRVRAQRLQR
jgi:hypothetical protein